MAKAAYLGDVLDEDVVVDDAAAARVEQSPRLVGQATDDFLVRHEHHVARSDAVFVERAFALDFAGVRRWLQTREKRRGG